MSTKTHSHSIEPAVPSYRQVARGIRSLKDVAPENTLLPASFDECVERLVQIYTGVKPLLAVLAHLPLFPPAWGRVIAMLDSSLDGVANRFKAGRDL